MFFYPRYHRFAQAARNQPRHIGRPVKQQQQQQGAVLIDVREGAKTIATLRLDDGHAVAGRPFASLCSKQLTLVPVAPPISPRCRQPATVIVPLDDADLAVVWSDPLVCGLPLCAAATAAHANPIANIVPTRFIDASFL